MTQRAGESAPRHDPSALAGQAHLEALRFSVDRLGHLAAPLTEEQLTGAAYPSEWTVAQVLSHQGSAAVITQRRFEDALAGQDTPDDFAPSVWATWNAKNPVAQRDDVLEADDALTAQLEKLGPADRDRFSSPMGPMTLDFAQFVGCDSTSTPSTPGTSRSSLTRGRPSRNRLRRSSSTTSSSSPGSPPGPRPIRSPRRGPRRG